MNVTAANATSPFPLTGGCQCGAVRFRAESLGRASICHCRMCQKALGNAFGPFVTARGLVWTRGAPKLFRSSNKVKRGFCGDCGTPLTYEPDGYPDIEIAIPTFDHPGAIAPVIQVGVEGRLPWTGMLHALPERTQDEAAAMTGFYAELFAGLESRQHPDHETAEWPPATRDRR